MSPHTPAVGVFLCRFPGATRITKDLKHVREGAAIGGLGDEEALAPQEDDKRDSDAGRRDDVADGEIHVLLDVGDATQGQDGAQVDAPIEPVEKTAGGFRASIFHLKEVSVVLGGHLV